MINLNKNIDVFFIDLDGTLLDESSSAGHAISEENMSAINKAESQGKKVIISTGRSGLQAKRFLDLFKGQYAVTGNGSLIMKNNKIIKEVLLTIKQSIWIIDFARQHKLALKIDDVRKGYGCRGKFLKYITRKIRLEPVSHFNIDLQKRYHKIILWGKSKSKLSKLSKVLSSELGGISMVSSGKGWTLEITHENATKGKGNLFVAKKLGIIDTKKMAHIGDSMNDSTANEYMRLIAMKNSDKNLKNITKYHGPHYKRAGVAKILNGEYTKK